MAARDLAEKLGAPPDVQQAAYAAGLLHDIAKATPKFQRLIRTTTACTTEEAEQLEGTGTYHNEIAYAILTASEGGAQLLDYATGEAGIKAARSRMSVPVSVLWHHACKDADLVPVLVAAADADAIAAVASELFPDRHFGSFEVETNSNFVALFKGPDVQTAAHFEKIVRTCLIAANHRVAALSAAECTAVAEGTRRISDLESTARVSNTISSNTSRNISNPSTENKQHKLCRRKHRNLIQVNTTASFENTKVAVTRMLERGRKTLWVCPKNALAERVYDNICNAQEEIGTNVSTELFLTNRRKSATVQALPLDCTSDIVVTNLDMLLKPQVDYRLPERMYQALLYDVVFDEFHEFAMPDSPLFYAFLTLVRARVLCTESDTVCMSATPTNMLELAVGEGSITYLPAKEMHFTTEQSQKLRINLVRTGETSSMPRPENGDNVAGTMVFLNSFRNAQKHTKKNDNRILIHGKFMDVDKARNVTTLLSAYGRGGAGTDSGKHIVASPSLQSMLGIAIPDVHVSSSCPETDIQAAHLNKLDDTLTKNVTYYDMHENQSERAAIQCRWDKDVQRLWFQFMEDRFQVPMEITYDDMYDAYDAFYQKHGDVILALFRKWRDRGMLRFGELAPVRYTRPRTGATHAHQPSLRSPDGSYLYITRNQDNTGWIPVEDAFSCDARELEAIAEHETWLENTREREKLVRRLGKDYRCLLTLPQGRGRLEFARDLRRPFPAQHLRYDPDDGVVANV